MEDSDLTNASALFFDEFVEVFSTFDGSQIARRYMTPYSALHSDGTIDCFSTHEDIASYFQDIVDHYHRSGCRSCRYRDLEVVPIGTRSVLGTVTWDLLGEDGTVLSSWRESYNLTRMENSLRVFASVDH